MTSSFEFCRYVLHVTVLAMELACVTPSADDKMAQNILLPARSKGRGSTMTSEKTSWKVGNPCRNGTCRGAEMTSQGAAGSDVNVDEMEEILNLVKFVSSELAGLRSSVQLLRVHGQAAHRQVRRLQRDVCGTSRRSRRRTRLQSHHHHSHRTSSHRELSPTDTDDREGNGWSYVHRRRSRSRKRHKSPSGGCPEDFIYGSSTDKCYSMSSDRVSWQTAQDRCRIMDSQLTTIHSFMDQQQLLELARSNSETAHCDFWIGLRRTRTTSGGRGRHYGTWKWSTRADEDQVLAGFENWNVGEPNDAGGGEDCVQMSWLQSWRWNDVTCDRSLACFVCTTSPISTVE